jgi:hypothetical protein
MNGEISYDLLMDEDMSFVEGSFRLEGGEWHVFVFLGNRERFRKTRFRRTIWDSGVSGIVYELPLEQPHNKMSVEQLLCQAVGAVSWTEVRGPDSMNLR